MNKPETTFIDNGRDDDLVDKIPDGYSYEGKLGGYPYGSFYKDRIEYAIEKQPADTKLLANIEFPLNFTVAAASPATVDVVVNNQQDPITLNTGSNVEVTWLSDNVTYCNCQCQNPNTGVAIDCGSNPPFPDRTSCGTELIKSTPRIIKIIVPIKFSVDCE